MVDLHIHTRFSHDSEEDPENYIRKAVELGKKAVSFTDHYDYRCIENGRQIPLPDLKIYTETFAELKEKYKGRIKVLCGLEVGYCREAVDRYIEIYERYPFDFFINSVHVVKGKDCFHNEFSKGLNAKEAYTLYFEQVLESLSAPYPFQVLGHLGYASRYTDYADKKIRYADFPEMIDRILCKIVEKNVALEINTSSAGSGSLLLPDLDIIARYTALGGRMFTFGSDAHTVARYCDKEEIVKSALSDLGIKRCCYFEKGKIVWEELA